MHTHARTPAWSLESDLDTRARSRTHTHTFSRTHLDTRTCSRTCMYCLCLYVCGEGDEFVNAWRVCVCVCVTRCVSVCVYAWGELQRHLGAPPWAMSMILNSHGETGSESSWHNVMLAICLSFPVLLPLSLLLSPSLFLSLSPSLSLHFSVFLSPLFAVLSFLLSCPFFSLSLSLSLGSLAQKGS